jgi:hypothetical protein
MYFKKILLYGAETWTCIKREESKLQAVKMKLLRATVGKTRRERIRNTYIKGELKMEEIQNQIKEGRLSWYGHVKRMDEHRIPKRLLEMSISGRRPRVVTPCGFVDRYQHFKGKYSLSSALKMSMFVFCVVTVCVDL